MGFIYIIENKVTEGAYIGSTLTTIENRYRRHVTDLKSGIHHSIFLQRAWNKYGEQNFEIRIIETVDDCNLLLREQFYLDERKKNYPPHKNYNICWIAGNCQGRILSPETRKKISQSQIGKVIPLETRLKMSNSQALKCGKYYTFVDPSGNEHETNNLRAFARLNNLCPVGLRTLAKGTTKHHKNWTLKGQSRKIFSFMSPEGDLHQNITNLKLFCKNNDLDYKSMSHVHKGNRKHYCGWVKV
jgi:group I intron endonuclease